MAVRARAVRLHVPRSDQLRMLDCLPSFRRDGLLCDVILKSIDGEAFSAHRLVLAMSSSAFRALVTGPFREGQAGAEVQFDASAATLRAVLDYLYEGCVEFPLSATIDLLRFSHRYELSRLQDQVADILPEHFTPGFCMQFLSILGSVGMERLQGDCKQYALEHFEECMETAEYLQCSGAHLLDLLEDDNLRTRDEEQVLRAIAIWYQEDPQRRSQDTIFLLRAVRLPLLSETSRASLRRAAFVMGVLGTRVSELLAMCATGQSTGRLRVLFRGPFSQWGCSVQCGVIVAGGNGSGDGPRQFGRAPSRLKVLEDERKTEVIVADKLNGRIVSWECREEGNRLDTLVSIVAGIGAPVNGINEISFPGSFDIDNERRLLVCPWPPSTGPVLFHDAVGARFDPGVMAFAGAPAPGAGQIVGAQFGRLGEVFALARQFLYDVPGTLPRMPCFEYLLVRYDRLGAGAVPATVTNLGVHSGDFFAGFFVATDGSCYIVAHHGQAVQRWNQGAVEGVIVAGGNGNGDALNQLSGARAVFVEEHTRAVYVADSLNHRVVRWTEGADVGELVAGGQGNGSELYQLQLPSDVAIGRKGSVYVLDAGNFRVMRWGPAPDLQDRDLLTFLHM